MNNTKQAVRELRDALRFVGAISYTEKLIRLGKACKELLPAVLDRLEELQRANLNLTEAYYRADAHSVAAARHCHELRTERDAIRAKYDELLESSKENHLILEAIGNLGQEFDAGDSGFYNKVFEMLCDGVPALDSSGDDTEDGREG